MRVVVTGAGGMLARTLVPTLQARGHAVIALAEADLDVTNHAEVARVLPAHRPDCVVQCAAFTAVDAAEMDEPTAFRVNADAAGYVAEVCQRMGASFVYPSTDYVFAGTGSQPYMPDDPVEPINAYGRSKAAGEAAAVAFGNGLVVRTSWLYGAGGKNFVDTITKLGQTRDRLQVVADQVGRPTWTGSLSLGISRLAEAGAAGVYHLTDVGPPISWFTFAEKVLSFQGLRTPVTASTTTDSGRAARRPAYSVLDCSKTELVLQCSLPHWEDALAEYLRQRADES